MWAWIGYFLLFSIVAFPAAPGLTVFKACLLAFVLVLVAIGVLRGQHTVHNTLIRWTFFFVMVGFLLILRGLFLATPGAWHLVGVHVLWPVVYLALVSAIANVKRIAASERILILASVFVPIYGFVVIAGTLGLLPGVDQVGLASFQTEQGVGFSDGYIQLSIHGLSSMSFLMPFTMAILTTHHIPKEGCRISRGWAWLALFLGFGLVLVSGRRALQLVTLLAPLLIFGFCTLQPPAERVLAKKFLLKLVLFGFFCTIALSFVISFMHEVSLKQIFHELALSFDFSATTASDSANERRIQFFALLHGWYENPIFGAGLGASAYGSIRSESMPWAYELSYLALLFQAGVVGLLTYATGITWIYWMGIRIIREGSILGRMMLPILVGLSSFLIANATNPYLGKFDGIWPIFLPLAIINYWLVQRQVPRLAGLSAIQGHG